MKKKESVPTRLADHTLLLQGRRHPEARDLRPTKCVGILLRDVGCHGCVCRSVLQDLDLVVPKCQGRRIRRQFCRTNGPRKETLSLAFLPEEAVRARQKKVTAILNSRDRMYRLGPAPQSGSRPIWPISVENRGQKSRCTFVYGIVARSQCIPISGV